MCICSTFLFKLLYYLSCIKDVEKPVKNRHMIVTRLTDLSRECTRGVFVRRKGGEGACRLVSATSAQVEAFFMVVVKPDQPCPGSMA